MNDISSRQNVKFKAWHTLLEARGIKKAARALISGEKLVREFLTQNPAAAEDLIYPPKAEEIDSPKNVKSYRLNAALFKELDVMGTKSPLLCVLTPELKVWKPSPAKGLELVVALSDPGNLGAVLRSAEAFGVTRVILTQEACSPFLPRSVRSSSGASFRIPLAKTDQPLNQISVSAGFSLDMDGEPLENFKWPRDLYLILGEEGRGVPQELKVKKLSISMAGKTESLNAMAAASIALFTYRNHFKN